MVGAPMDAVLEIPIPGLFLAQEKKITGSLLGSCHSHRDVPRFIALWKIGKLDFEAMISHRHARRPRHPHGAELLARRRILHAGARLSFQRFSAGHRRAHSRGTKSW